MHARDAVECKTTTRVYTLHGHPYGERWRGGGAYSNFKPNPIHFGRFGRSNRSHAVARRERWCFSAGTNENRPPPGRIVRVRCGAGRWRLAHAIPKHCVFQHMFGVRFFVVPVRFRADACSNAGKSRAAVACECAKFMRMLGNVCRAIN